MRTALCARAQIAADNAVFGQTGPKVGSFDAGYGSTHMVRLIGERQCLSLGRSTKQSLSLAFPAPALCPSLCQHSVDLFGLERSQRSLLARTCRPEEGP